MRQLEGTELIGNGAQMVELKQEIGRIARSDAKVLITGESGVGKELVARAHPHEQPAPAARVHPRELRGASRDAARVGAVRPREGLVHRRVSRQAGQAGSGR